jgi:hypothetical protein
MEDRKKKGETQQQCRVLKTFSDMGNNLGSCRSLSRRDAISDRAVETISGSDCTTTAAYCR